MERKIVVAFKLAIATMITKWILFFFTLFMLWLMRDWDSEGTLQYFALACVVIAVWNFCKAVARNDEKEYRLLALFVSWLIFSLNDIPYLLPFFALSIAKHWH